MPAAVIRAVRFAASNGFGWLVGGEGRGEPPRFVACEFIRSVPHKQNKQNHQTKQTNHNKYIIDTHRGHVIDEVWDLYRETIRLSGAVSTLIEWDDESPVWAVLAAEAEKARAARNEALGLAATLPTGKPAEASAPAEPPGTNQGGRHGGPRELAAREDSSLGAAIAE